MTDAPESINGQSITTTAARPRLGFSAQANWQRKQQQKGNCRACGKDRRTPEEVAAGVEVGQGKLKQLCRPCQDKCNVYMNNYRKNKKAATLTTESAPEEKSNEGQPNAEGSSTSVPSTDVPTA